MFKNSTKTSQWVRTKAQTDENFMNCSPKFGVVCPGENIWEWESAPLYAILGWKFDLKVNFNAFDDKFNFNLTTMILFNYEISLNLFPILNEPQLKNVECTFIKLAVNKSKPKLIH